MKVKIKKEDNMKRTLVIILMAILSMVLVHGNADALVGLCSDCHTMHDRQGDVDQGTTGAQERLLVSSCIACHTSTTAGAKLTTL